jgi:enoyl-CoA hydratase/carnithine racemase
VIEAALLPRLIGWGKTNYLLLTGENINAETAYDWGFLERLTKTNKLASESIEIAESIVASGPHAIRAQKELIRQWETLSLEDGIEAGISAFSNAYTTDEPTTMMQSFFDRKDR